MLGIVLHLVHVSFFDWLGNSVDAVVNSHGGKGCLEIRRFGFSHMLSGSIFAHVSALGCMHGATQYMEYMW